MDILLILGMTSDEPNKVQKSLTGDILEISGKFKEEQDITSPAITISVPTKTIYDSDGNPKIVPEYIFQYNYATVSFTYEVYPERFVYKTRYYFITGFDTGLNNTVTIYLKEDVLMTYKEEIYKLTPLVTRQATEYNGDLFDGDIPIDSEPEVTIADYGFKFFDFSIKENVQTHKKEVYVETSNNNSLGVDSSYLVSTFITKGDLFINQPSKPISCGSSYNPIFSLKASELSVLAKEFFSASITEGFFLQKSDFVSSVTYVPWGKSLKGHIFIAGDGIKTFSQIPVGNTNFSLGTDCLGFTQGHILILPTDEIEITTRYFDKNYLNLITDIDIYVPYSGWKNLDNNLLLKFSGNNSTIKCYGYYFIDAFSLQFNFILTTQQLNLMYRYEEIDDLVHGYYDTVDLEKIIMSCDGLIGGEAPWGSTNKGDNYRNIFLGLTLSALGIVAKNPTLTLSGLLSAANVDTSAITNAQKRLKDKRVRRPETIAARKKDLTKAEIETGVKAGVTLACNTLSTVLPNLTVRGGLTSSGSFFGGSMITESRVILRYTRPKPNIPSNYYELYGGPCNLTVPLSTLKDKGFTKCANLHMNGFPNCTLEEINEIEDLLLSGVIL